MGLPQTSFDYLSEEEYLKMERASEIRHEYFDGELFAMSGASEKHNTIVGNVVRELGVQMKKMPCKVYPSDMRVKIPKTGLYTYPDVAIVCGKPQLGDDKYRDILLNPIVVVEVLSDSTEKYDRGVKFQHYRKIPSLKEYVLISQDEPKIERYFKNEGGLWTLRETEDEHTEIILESINCVLSLSEVYDKTGE